MFLNKKIKGQMRKVLNECVFFQSPELPPKIKEPTRAVVREHDSNPAERARSCRNRLMELYGNKDTASDK